MVQGQNLTIFSDSDDDSPLSKRRRLSLQQSPIPQQNTRSPMHLLQQFIRKLESPFTGTAILTIGLFSGILSGNEMLNRSIDCKTYDIFEYIFRRFINLNINDPLYQSSLSVYLGNDPTTR